MIGSDGDATVVLDRPESARHQRRNSLFNREKDRNRQMIPWVLSLGLHVGAILVFWNLPRAPMTRPEVMQVMLARPNETPQFFSELPPDRADAAPKKPDSSATSRAARAIAFPVATATFRGCRARGCPDGEARAGGSPSPAPAGTLPQSREAEGVRAAQSQVPQKADGNNSSRCRTRPFAVRRKLDHDQPEMAHPDGNASLLGDVSLNTTAWEYAPWLQRFCTRLRERWFAPPAYMMGILKDGGWALVEVEISRAENSSSRSAR
jgi:hypothetical protein